MYDLGQYIPKDSVIHHLDPRIKIVSMVVMGIMVLHGGPSALFMMTLFVTGLMAVSRTKIRQVQRALKPVWIFFTLLFALHLFLTKGTPIPPFPAWPVTPTYEGLYTGALTTWQFVLLVVTAALLTMTTSPGELISGIERLLRPLKFIRVPSHDVAMMVSLALRFVPTLLGEIARMRDAQTARGATFNHGHILKRLKAVSGLVLPVVWSAFRRADALALAMEARGYRGGARTMLRQLRLSKADYVAVMVMGILTGGYVLVLAG